MNISEKIQKIIDQRKGLNEYKGKGRLDVINEKIRFFKNLKEEVEKFALLRNSILNQINEQRGEYYSISATDPTFTDNITCADPTSLLNLIDSSLKECSVLVRRFDKDTINISVIGKAGQGKSKLLQSISGLSNDIIPADNGGDCTGAKSVICNAEGETRAHVVFFNEIELCEQVNKYIESIAGDKDTLKGVSSIKSLDLGKIKECVGNSSKKDSQFSHLRKYVEHYDSYIENLGKEIDVNSSEIRKYVAQYLDDKNQTPVYNYLSVKEVQIYTPFKFHEAGKIMLVDTIGLGDTSIGLRDKLIDTMISDSDAAVLLRRPEHLRDSIREDDNELIDLINDKMEGRTIEKWLFYALNIWDENRKNGELLYKSISDKLGTSIKAAFVRKVNCADKQDVEDGLLIPMLETLTENLDIVDNNLFVIANKRFTELHSKYYELCTKVKSVLNSNFKQKITVGGLFDELYENDLPLSRSLEKLCNEYKSQKECLLIMEQIKSVVECMADNVPHVDVLVKELTEGDLRSRINTVYNEYVDQTRSKINIQFEEISNQTISDLQEGVKKQIIEILRSDAGGKLDKIVLSRQFDENDYNEWLECFINEKLDNYPNVKKTFESISNYRLNIEGLIEYKVNGVLEEFLNPDKMDELGIENNGSPEIIARAIEQMILQKIPLIGAGIIASIVDVLLIPYSSFRARIRKTQERLIFSKEGRREIKELYRENCGAIWSKEVSAVSLKETAITDLKNTSNALSCLEKKELFTLNIEC